VNVICTSVTKIHIFWYYNSHEGNFIKMVHMYIFVLTVFLNLPFFPPTEECVQKYCMMLPLSTFHRYDNSYYYYVP
jgi:hypothetical protein